MKFGFGITARAAAVVVLAVSLSACQSIGYQINIVEPDGTTTDIYAHKLLMPWSEMKQNEIALLTGVAPDGSWFVVTGESMEHLIQNPKIAKAALSGFAAGLAKAVFSTMGLP